jgi:hypothetical protein
MERLATWLDEAKQVNVWRHTEDTLQTAMLHGMLIHLQREIEALLEAGGPELQETVQALRTLAVQEKQ